MDELQVGSSLPSKEHHEGAFRPMNKLYEALEGITPETMRGGPDYGEFIEQIRGVMDKARLASPSNEQATELIGLLKQLNDKLADTVVDEWSAPAWTRLDVPARGNITEPPYLLDRAEPDGVEARMTFRTFHLGANAAVHGGQVCVGFDQMLGMTAALSSGAVTRTASLTVDYRSLTPLNTELTLRAWPERQEGRKVYVRATLHDGERLCAEAHGLFIVLKAGQQ
ncbi:PaaI family thioesterase [Nocardia callitridis]|uniref:Acyl-coenzyme A thioesterase THEM4 n=1 Tax=Nocardia callitridis TaxID=648753 RepID=A0ABP9KN04_9NOCA